MKSGIDQSEPHAVLAVVAFIAAAYSYSWSASVDDRQLEV